MCVVVGGVSSRVPVMWLRVCCLRCVMAVVWLRRCCDDDGLVMLSVTMCVVCAMCCVRDDDDGDDATMADDRT
jgi:hypothetical protein